MGKPYSTDLCERVVAAVEAEALLCHQAAVHSARASAQGDSGCRACVRP